MQNIEALRALLRDTEWAKDLSAADAARAIEGITIAIEILESPKPVARRAHRHSMVWQGRTVESRICRCDNPNRKD